MEYKKIFEALLPEFDLDSIVSYVGTMGDLIEELTLAEYATYNFDCHLTEASSLAAKNGIVLSGEAIEAKIRTYAEFVARYSEQDLEKFGITKEEYLSYCDGFNGKIESLFRNAEKVEEADVYQRIVNYIYYGDKAVILGFHCEVHID